MLLLIQPQQTISGMMNEWFEEESVTKCGQRLYQVLWKTSSQMKTLLLSNFAFT